MEAERALKPLCSATRNDGSPCHGYPDASGRCPAHRPGFREIAAKGGRNKAKRNQLERRLPDKLKPVLDILSTSIEDVKAGTMTPAQGSSIAALATSICRVTEMAEFEIRLKVFEIEARRGTTNDFIS